MSIFRILENKDIQIMYLYFVNYSLMFDDYGGNI